MKKNNYLPYLDGNRMPVPDGINSAHFLYKVKKQAVNSESVAIVRDYLIKNFYKKKRSASNFLVYDKLNFMTLPELVKSATKIIGIDIGVHSKCSLICCEWAQVHNDDGFAGSSFLSLVVNTGPYPYVIQTLSTRSTSGKSTKLEVVHSTRTVEVGDLFVFDPTSAHQAIPQRPADGQLLALIQWELFDNSPTQREMILKNFPPRRGDRSL